MDCVLADGSPYAEVDFDQLQRVGWRLASELSPTCIKLVFRYRAHTRRRKIHSGSVSRLAGGLARPYRQVYRIFWTPGLRLLLATRSSRLQLRS